MLFFDKIYLERELQILHEDSESIKNFTEAFNNNEKIICFSSDVKYYRIVTKDNGWSMNYFYFQKDDVGYPFISCAVEKILVENKKQFREEVTRKLERK